ncbi:helix-turn-helix transcriptional regulator [Mucilaginibacter sp. BJC16-A38]|uniref:helix-turn-helix domain-containing protein n=1 Tax=Mucilaginibacter phenanthrenivorans TaxID=1234842 RepID=UPI0021570752|nr:helix-turn-helix transcriptional regulator [Mucilaginibacter phenanthrenivorans]MCR8559299.1 helix-turn-helix transcriptional regulator [Mucilaginibacter phenanthrenivorans]
MKLTCSFDKTATGHLHYTWYHGGMTNTTKYPNNLRHYRLKRKFTQQEVLGHLGHASASRLSAWENGEAVPATQHLVTLRHASASRLSAWENGEAVPATQHLVTLSLLYGVPVDKVVGGFAKQKKAAVTQKAAFNESLLTPANQFLNYSGKNHDDMREARNTRVFFGIRALGRRNARNVELFGGLTVDRAF